MPGLQASATPASAPVTYHGNSSDLWDYAVPLEPDLGHYQEGSAPSSLKSRTNNTTNGYSSKISGTSPNPLDSTGYLNPATAESLRHKESINSSNQDGDSLFDLYGGKMSTTGAMSTETINNHNGNLTDEESKWIDSEKLARIEGKQLEQLKQAEYNTRWIDRDKLERIEIQELEQAGIIPPTGARESYNALPTSYQPENGAWIRQRANSDSSGDEARFYDPSEPDNDLRHPAERSADMRGQPMQNYQRNRSSSRIPLYTSSLVPVPQHHLERNAPLVRQPPSPENVSDDDGSSYTRSRKRSYSASSTVLLTEGTPPTTAVNSAPKTAASPHTSRVKSNIASPNRSNSKSKTRFSGNSSLAKNKTRSNPQLTPSHRPTSSHHSHQAPEGPPPWQLSNYTPDPKLPPDQQIIPTVAKRLQQEQWEKEGVFATVYDKKLRPLKVQDPEQAPVEKGEVKEIQTDTVEELETIALTDESRGTREAEKTSIVDIQPPKEGKDDKGVTEPSVPLKDEGQSAPHIAALNSGQGGSKQAIRMNIPDKVEKKKKFACCIVM